MKLYPLLVLLLCFGCGFHAVSENNHDATPRDNALKLDLEVEPLIIEYGGTLFIELTITNNTPETIARVFGSGCIYGFSILTPAGTRVGPEPRICTMNAPTIRYKPGEVVVRKFEWRWDDSHISPGKYLLRAGLGEYGMDESPPPIEIELR